MNTPQQAPRWTSDPYGSSNLYPPQGGHVWLQARRPYCDRGHWEWGSTGVPHGPQGAPSYYFMDLERARAEIERWLVRALGGEGHACELPGAGDFQRQEGRQAGWHWRSQDDGLVAQAGQARLVLALDPASGAIVMDAEGIDGLDASDCFPRRYLDAGVAMAEAEDFLVWRLLKIPTQVPGPITGDHPVGDALLGCLSGNPPRPRRRPMP